MGFRATAYSYGFGSSSLGGGGTLAWQKWAHRFAAAPDSLQQLTHSPRLTELRQAVGSWSVKMPRASRTVPRWLATAAERTAETGAAGLPAWPIATPRSATRRATTPSVKVADASNAPLAPSRRSVSRAASSVRGCPSMAVATWTMNVPTVVGVRGSFPRVAA